MLKEFKEFAMRGNILDMAVGVIIGGAFQKIVTSLVDDIIMPVISIFTGDVNFDDLAIEIGNASIKYGAFLTAILDFLIIAFSIFMLIRYINKLNKKLEQAKQEGLKKLNIKAKDEPAPEPTTKVCPFCYSEIDIHATRCPHCTSDLSEK